MAVYFQQQFNLPPAVAPFLMLVNMPVPIIAWMERDGGMGRLVPECKKPQRFQGKTAEIRLAKARFIINLKLPSIR